MGPCKAQHSTSAAQFKVLANEDKLYVNRKGVFKQEAVSVTRKPLLQHKITKDKKRDRKKMMRNEVNKQHTLLNL